MNSLNSWQGDGAWSRSSPGLPGDLPLVRGFTLIQKCGSKGVTLDTYMVPDPRQVQLERVAVVQSLSSVQSLSRVQLFATPCTVAHQAPLSMGVSRRGYWSGLPFPSLGIFPTQD